MFSPFSPLSLALLISTCSASPITARQWDGMTVPDPSTDPWYTRSGVDDISWYSPGDVLDRRAVKIPAGFQSSVASAWQIKFRTSDSNGGPTWAITTLYSPKDHSNDPALVSYQHFTDSTNLSLSPSYAIYTDDIQNFGALPYFVTMIIQKHPSWFVNIPDYEGPSASFGAGIMAGHATLDSIRAVRRLSRYTGLTEDVPVALWGYSGGALATEWAAELQGDYAPELKIKAAVMGGLTPNMTSMFESLSRKDSTRADLIPEAVRGLATQYPQVKPDLMTATKTNSWDEAINALKNSASNAAKKADSFATLRRYIGDLLSSRYVQRILQSEGLMGYFGGPPQIPLYIHHAQIDEVAPVQDVRNLVARYCGYQCGMIGVSLLVNLTTKLDTASSHYDEGKRGINLALDTWLPDALAGRNLLRGCNQTAAP